MFLYELNHDVLRLLLDGVPDAFLARCLATSKAMFLAVVPILWSRGHQVVDNRLIFEAGDPPKPWTAGWRLAQYAQAIPELLIYDALPPLPEPARLLPWLGSLNVVRISFADGGADNGGEGRARVQLWVDAIIDLLRRGQGPCEIHVGAGCRRDVLEQFLSSPSVTAIGLADDVDEEMAAHLRHGVRELRAPIGFAWAYKHTASIRKLTLLHDDGVDLDALDWHLPVITDLTLELGQAHGYLEGLLGSTRSTLRRLAVSRANGSTVLTQADLESITSLRGLLSLELDIHDGEVDLSLLSHLPDLQSLKLTVDQGDSEDFGDSDSDGDRDYQCTLTSVEPVLERILERGKLRELHLKVSGRFKIDMPCVNLARLTLVNVKCFIKDWDTIDGWLALEVVDLRSSALVAHVELDMNDYMHGVYPTDEQIVLGRAGMTYFRKKEQPQPKMIVDGSRVHFWTFD
ncbi:hypothetical protein HK101_010306 [Irineochytrium annulatum]|nr:hypothetical protein HK101_010306 [Irineochytrium annulatum]